MAILIALVLFIIMVVWLRGTEIEDSQAVGLSLKDYIKMLGELRNDETMQLRADNLVYITKDNDETKLDRDILYSIFDKQPKRAQAYWFVNIDVTDEPYTKEYSVNNYGTDYIFMVQLRLGFKIHQRVNVYLRQVVTDLIESGELPPQFQKYSIYEQGKIGSFRFCLIRKLLVPESDIPASGRLAISMKYMIRHIAGSPVRWYGLENSPLLVEYVPLFVKMKGIPQLERITKNQKNR